MTFLKHQKSSSHAFLELCHCRRMSNTFRIFLALILMLTATSALDISEDDSLAPKTLESKLPIMISSATDQTELAEPPPTIEGEEVPPDMKHGTNGTRENDRVDDWKCPNVTGANIECSCDFPHTLRCTGDRAALQVRDVEQLTMKII